MSHAITSKLRALTNIVSPPRWRRSTPEVYDLAYVGEGRVVVDTVLYNATVLCTVRGDSGKLRPVSLSSLLRTLAAASQDADICVKSDWVFVGDIPVSAPTAPPADIRPDRPIAFNPVTFCDEAASAAVSALRLAVQHSERSIYIDAAKHTAIATDGFHAPLPPADLKPIAGATIRCKWLDAALRAAGRNPQVFRLWRGGLWNDDRAIGIATRDFAIIDRNAI